jgi:hypothetical protein
MRWATMAILLILLLSAYGFAGQPAKTHAIDEYFQSQSIVTAKYFADLDEPIEEEEAPLMGDIYAFKAKSPKRAFFYSLAVPGAGEFYAGSKVKPAVFVGLEAILWSGYIIYTGKGNNIKDDYIAYAKDHYKYDIFMTWWSTLDSATQNKYSHTLPWDEQNNSPIFNHEYFENIGKYNEFQVGWDDIGPGYPPPPVPGGRDTTSVHREFYLNLRRKSNDYYQNASTMVILALGNHILSAFDAALTAKSYNKGQKRFSLMLKSKKIENAQVPFLTWSYKF